MIHALLRIIEQNRRKKSLDPTTNVHMSQQNVRETYHTSACAHSPTMEVSKPGELVKCCTN